MACLFPGLASCGANRLQTELKQINVACFPNITHAQALLMKGRGSLEQAFGDDIKINWITLYIIAGASNGGSVLVSRNDAGIGSARNLAGKTWTTIRWIQMVSHPPR